MKNQWFGDIHDFRKYGLLAFLSNCYNNIYIDWMLTKDIPDTKDGKIVKFAGTNRKNYWAPATAGKIQKQIWEYLHNFHMKPDNIRHVSYGMQFLSHFNNNCNFFSSLDYEWNNKQFILSQQHLIFFDADNGLANNIPNKKIKTESDPRYITCEKIDQYLNKQFSVLIYQHNTLSCLRSFSTLCKNCIETLSVDREDIIVFKGGHVVYFLIEKNKMLREEIIKKFHAEEFSPRYLKLLNV